MENLIQLQKGNRICGVSMDGVDGEAVVINNDIVLKIVYTFSVWLQNKLGKETPLKFSVGHDNRLTGWHFAQASCLGLVSAGNLVYDCEWSTTPSMGATVFDDELNCDGAVMVTASILPFGYNGLRFFTKSGEIEQASLTEILELAETLETPFLLGGKRIPHPFIPTYAQGIIAKIRKLSGEERPFEGLKIIVDAGNGAGGFYPKLILQPLGADTTGSQYLEPDGHFPNRNPNPNDKKALDGMITAMVKFGADFGMLFNSDADDLVIVDAKGHIVQTDEKIGKVLIESLL